MFDKKTAYKIDSGLGGVFEIRFKGETDTAYLFRIVSPGWQRDLQIPKDRAHEIKQDQRPFQKV